MPIIEIVTLVEAPQQVVFDLARSVDLHTRSTAQTGEQAVAGVTSGLLSAGDEVTWRARHLGVWQELTARITLMEAPDRFVDEQVRGAFARFRHEHRFSAAGEGTRMVDVFDYTAPLGALGRLADVLFLERYMRRFLLQRNAVLKEVAESGGWREILPSLL